MSKKKNLLLLFLALLSGCNGTDGPIGPSGAGQTSGKTVAEVSVAATATAPASVYAGEANSAGNHQGMLDHIIANTGVMIAPEFTEDGRELHSGTMFVCGPITIGSGHVAQGKEGGFTGKLGDEYIFYSADDIIAVSYNEDNPSESWNPLVLDYMVAKTPINIECYTSLGSSPEIGSTVNIIGHKWRGGEHIKYVLTGTVAEYGANSQSYYKINLSQESKDLLARDGFTDLRGHSGGIVVQNDKIVGGFEAGQGLDYGIALRPDILGGVSYTPLTSSTTDYSVDLTCSTEGIDHHCFQLLDGVGNPLDVTYWSNKPSMDNGSPKIKLSFSPQASIDSITLDWYRNCAGQYTITLTGNIPEGKPQTIQINPTETKSVLQESYSDEINLREIYGQSVNVSSMEINLLQTCQNGHFLGDAGFYTLRGFDFGFSSPGKISSATVNITNPNP